MIHLKRLLVGLFNILLFVAFLGIIIAGAWLAFTYEYIGIMIIVISVLFWAYSIGKDEILD